MTDERNIASPYLTAQEAAEYLRLKNVRSIYHLIRMGRLVPKRQGQFILFTREQLDALID